MRPLIYSVEDDLNIQNVIKIALQNSNFDIRLFSEAEAMFQALNDQKPSLFLLDIMLPNTDGLEILRILKASSEHRQIPVMIISAKTSEIDKVIGLDIGADDYLVKPFGVLELVSRVKALLRRSSNILCNETITAGALSLIPNKFKCTYQNKTIIFTKKQFELLKLLMVKHGDVVSRDEILNEIWGYEYVGETRTVDVHIKEIRKKLKQAGISDKTIETVRGIGYTFVL